jgi:hypothetical protein
MALGVCCYNSYIMYQVPNLSCVARDLRHEEGGGSRSRRRSAERVRSDEPEGCRYVYCAVEHWHGEYRMGVIGVQCLNLFFSEHVFDSAPHWREGCDDHC